jgi:hypothetical protein
MLVRGVGWAAAAVDRGTAYYIGLAVLVVIMIGVLIAAYRTWEEINDVEDPDSPADLLESFEQAHQEGELDEQELDRVRRLLSAGNGADDPSRTRGAVRGNEGKAKPGD